MNVLVTGGAGFLESALCRHSISGSVHRAVDPSKIERDLGWRALETFESGLAKTVRWYVENRWWWEAIRIGRYEAQRLGTAAGQGR